MPVTPQINLVINLLDYSGVQQGSVGSPAYVRIALANYGQYTPEVSGTGTIAKVASSLTDIPYTGAPLTIALFGNDVISPANTFYVISVLDSNRNVIQAVPYQFAGSGTINLDTASPYNFVSPTPIAPTVVAGLVTVPYALVEVFDCSLVTAGLITFDLTLTGNVSASTLINAQPGQIITFVIAQDFTGNRGFTWPSNVLNHTPVDPDSFSVTVQSFVMRANGFAYPIGLATFN